jgi:hypothetical protein
MYQDDRELFGISHFLSEYTEDFHKNNIVRLDLDNWPLNIMKIGVIHVF